MLRLISELVTNSYSVYHYKLSNSTAKVSTSVNLINAESTHHSQVIELLRLLLS
jgi:hypothetical protein